MTDSAAPAAFKLEWQKQMLRDHSISMSHRALGAHLFNYANGDGTRVRPGRARLVAELGMSESTVDRALAALRNAGWIVRVKRGSNTGRANMADVYRLVISETAVLGTYEHAVADDECPSDQSSSVTSATPEPVVNHAGTTRQPCVEQSSSMREPLVTDEDLPDQGPNQRPNQGPNHVAHPGAEARSGQGSASNDAPHMTDPEFSQFWDVYPNKRDRKRAYPVFVEAKSRASVDAIIAGAERYRDDPNRDWTKEPKTWLEGDCWDDAPIPPKGQSSTRTWMDMARGFVSHARHIDGHDHGYVEAEIVEVSEPAPLRAAQDPPVLTAVKDNDAPDAFTEFLNAYPKPTPPAQRYAAHKAWQAAAKAHGADRVLKAAQRYTKAFEEEGKDPAFAKRVADWFKDDSFDRHLPHRFEPYKGMNVVKWLDLVTEHRDIAIAQRYATGDTFLPEWPAECEGWTKAQVDDFRESEKLRWFREHRQMHLDVLTRRYGEVSEAA